MARIGRSFPSKVIFLRPTQVITIGLTGIASAEAFGTPDVRVEIDPSGIASAETFGTPQITVNPTGIATAEAFGSPSLEVNLSPTGIASVEAFGTADIKLEIDPSGVASAETFGTPAVSTTVTLSPSSITSAEAFGTVSVAPELHPPSLDAYEDLRADAHAFWRLEEGGGSRQDVTFNGHDLTPHNDQGSDTGKIGDAGLFVASFNTHYDTPSSADLQGGDRDISIALWVYIDAATNGQDFSPIIEKGSILSFSEYLLYFLYDNSSINFQFNDGVDVQTVEVTDLAQNQWYFVQAWYDSSTLKMYLKVDLLPTQERDVNGGNPTGADPVVLGADTTDGDYFDGRVDEVGFWQRLLTEQERTYLYGNGDGVQLYPAETQFGFPSLPVEPSGIASEEAFGTASIIAELDASGVASAEAAGTPDVKPELDPSGISSGEVFGSEDVRLELDPSGIASAEAFGLPSNENVVSPSSIASVEAFGSPDAQLEIDPSGISSQEALGDLAVSTAADTIQPSSIAGAEDFGTASVAAAMTPSGIASAVAFGSPSLTLVVNASGVTSSEAFGTCIVSESYVVAPDGVPADDQYGTPTLTPVLQPSGVSSLSASGQADVRLQVGTTGIPSQEAFGVPYEYQSWDVTDAGDIASAEALGAPAVSYVMQPNGVESAEAFGVTSLEWLLYATAITSQEAFGVLDVGIEIDPTGIPSADVVGEHGAAGGAYARVSAGYSVNIVRNETVIYSAGVVYGVETSIDLTCKKVNDVDAVYSVILVPEEVL